MSNLTTDANGDEIAPLRGLRLCEVCGLVMSEGYVVEEDGSTVCEDECLARSEWQWPVHDGESGDYLGLAPITPELIWMLFGDEEDGEGTAQVYWTDWEGDEHSEEALKRLLTAPYNWTPDEIKSLEEANA